MIDRISEIRYNETNDKSTGFESRETVNLNVIHSLRPTQKKASLPTPLQQAKLLKKVIERALQDQKALDVVSINLENKSDMAYFMVIASGTSSRHVSSLAEKVAEAVKDAGFGVPAMEGLELGEWALLDNPLVMVHIFKPDTRVHYNLEKMWQAEFASSQETVAVF